MVSEINSRTLECGPALQRRRQAGWHGHFRDNPNNARIAPISPTSSTSTSRNSFNVEPL
jgi:hypothetical protein